MKTNVIHLKAIRAALLIAIVAAMLAAPAWAAVLTPDSVTVATVNGPQFSVVNVPVSIRDLSSTPLGLDQPAGSHIQAYSIKVNYAPASAVQSITFTHSGITSSLTPAFETNASGVGTITLIDSFSEVTNPIPFTLNGAAPGNEVAQLHVSLSPTATPGTIITLSLDTTLTTLSNDSGTTSEMTSSSNLTLVDGSITVTPSVPAMSHLTILLLALTLAVLGMRVIRF